MRLVRDLPQDLGAAICIVLHISPGSPSMLAHILDRAGKLPCRPARDGESLREGVILVAPPDHHLAIEDSRVRLTVGPREHGHRPAIDVLFRSAASAFDSRVVGVVLTGTRDDGSAGMAVIKAAGGGTIVQDPNDALYSGMPASAIANVTVDAIVPSAALATTIAAMVSGEDPPPEARPGDSDPDPPDGAQISAVCPECGGILTERAEAEDVEGALWAAIRALADRGALLERMAQQANQRGRPRSARWFRRQSHAATEQAQIMRGALPGVAGTTLGRISEIDREGHGDEGAA